MTLGVPVTRDVERQPVFASGRQEAGRPPDPQAPVRHGRRPARRLSRLSDDALASYAFLHNHGLAPEALARAVKVGRRWRCSPHHVLIALGWMTAEAYAAALARHLGVELRRPPRTETTNEAAIDALALRPDEVVMLVEALRAQGHHPRLELPPVAARGVRPSLPPEEAALEAAGGLKRRRPAESAASAMWLWQRLAIAVVSGMLAGGAAIAPAETIAVLLGLLVFPFVLVTGLRVLSVLHLTIPGWRASNAEAAAERVPNEQLPIYTVLVPLYDEAEVVGDLVAALTALDYPSDRLDILILVEASDTTTRVRLNAEQLPASFRVLVVPTGEPQTKPRALNFGMQYARGAFVVVYDAEDAPEPDQLRRAFAVLRERPEEIGCIQARLNIYNTSENWLTRQFTIEYSALFDGLLPTLEHFGLPIPLGGTSNHFPRALLDALGGWDPYNVTEDADLGVRLARRGWKVAVIGSTTWEEAPRRFGDWLKQRTRWLKGWMQTTLVHNRRPMRLMREIGDIRFLSLQALLGGVILASLVHPWFYVVLAVEAWRGDLMSFPESLIAQSIWGLAAVNLLLGVIAALRRGHLALAVHVVFLPFYWLAVSLAAYRALFQLMRDPFRWEKTPHRRRKGRDKGGKG